jgi:hypothetical protein
MNLTNQELLDLLEAEKNKNQRLLDEVKDFELSYTKELSEKDNLNLPVPRLEMRLEEIDQVETIAYLNLVYKDMFNKIKAKPLSVVKVSYQTPSTLGVDFFSEPSSMSGEIRNYMLELGLRGFTVAKGQFRELDL